MVNEIKIILTDEEKKCLEDVINIRVGYKKRIILDNVSHHIKNNMTSILVRAGKKYIAITATNDGEKYTINRGSSTGKLHKALVKEDMYKMIAAMATLRCLWYLPHKY